MTGTPGPGTTVGAHRPAGGELVSPLSRLAGVRRLLRRAEAAFRDGDLAAAERSGRRAVDRLRTRGGGPAAWRRGEREAFVVGTELIACVRREVSDFTAAAELHRHALAALDTSPNDPALDRLHIAVLSRLGDTVRLLAAYADAERHLTRAVQLADRLQPPDPILRADTLNGLGILYKDTRRFARADQHYRQALHQLEQTLGPDDLHLAPLYHNLAGLAHAQDHFVDGESAARHALELRSRHEGPGTTGAAADLGVLGALLLGQHRYTEAEDVLEQSLAIWQSAYGPSHYEVAVTRHNLAAIYAARGEHDRARDTLQRVLDTKTQRLGHTHPDVTALRNHLNRPVLDARTPMPEE